VSHFCDGVTKLVLLASLLEERVISRVSPSERSSSLHSSIESED